MKTSLGTLANKPIQCMIQRRIPKTISILYKFWYFFSFYPISLTTYDNTLSGKADSYNTGLVNIPDAVGNICAYVPYIPDDKISPDFSIFLCIKICICMNIYMWHICVSCFILIHPFIYPIVYSEVPPNIISTVQWDVDHNPYIYGYVVIVLP